MEIDSRPSDAIALAVRVQAPIFAEETVLEKAGVRLDQETGEEKAETEGRSEVKEEELEKLSPFRDFIDSLDMEDFEKRGGTS
jgi:bifunctional DNase/RNase